METKDNMVSNDLVLVESISGATSVANASKCNNSKVDFGFALKKWRLRCGLSQIAAAEKLGCSRYTIIRVENGRDITWEQMYKLAVNLGRAMAEENEIL